MVFRKERRINWTKEIIEAGWDIKNIAGKFKFTLILERISSLNCLRLKKESEGKVKVATHKGSKSKVIQIVSPWKL